MRKCKNKSLYFLIIFPFPLKVLIIFISSLFPILSPFSHSLAATGFATLSLSIDTHC